MKTLRIPREEARHIQYLLTHKPKDESECMGEEETVVYTVNFGNSYEMDIKLCGVQYEEGGYNLPWTEAVLFHNASEVACSEPDDEFFGHWTLEHQGTEFHVFVQMDSE